MELGVKKVAMSQRLKPRNLTRTFYLDTKRTLDEVPFANEIPFVERQNFKEKGLAKSRYQLKTTDVVVDGVKYTIPNNAMKPESAKGFIKFLNKLEKDPTLENYRKLVAGLDKNVGDQIRNYRYYLQGLKQGAFIGRDGKETGVAMRKLFDEIKSKLPKKSTNLLSRITSKDIKGQIVQTATKAASEAAKGTSMDVANAVRDIFVNDPNNAPSLDEIAEGLEGSSKWNAASESEKIKMRTAAKNAVSIFLQAITADRKVKGFKDVAPETLGDIIQYIDDNKRGEFGFSEGLIRDYKIKLRDSLIKGDFAKKRRELRGQKNQVIDEVFGLSATYENAPGYTENVQIISDKANKLKRTQIDKPFAAILKAVKEGRDTVTYDKKRNVPISEAVKKFNAKSKTFSKVNNISTPLILVGDNLNANELVSNFKDYSPQAQKNILDLADEGFVLTSTKPATPVGKLAFKPGMQSDGQLKDYPGGNTKGSFGGKELAKATGQKLLQALKILGSPGVSSGYGAYELGQGNIKMAGGSLLLPEIAKGVAPQGAGILSKLGRLALNPYGRYARGLTPVGLATIGIGMGKDVYDEYLRRQALTPTERLAEDLEAQQKFDEVMIGAAEGGRIGFADGPEDPSKRTFLKIMGGLASLPVVGKFFKKAEQAAPVVSEGVKLGFDNFMKLVKKIKMFGEDVSDKASIQERQKVIRYQGKDGSEYELVEDITTGDIIVQKDKPGVAVYGRGTDDVEGVDVIEDRSVFSYKKGEEMIDTKTGKGVKAPDEYDEMQAIAHDGMEFDDVDVIKDKAVKEVLDEID